MTGLFARKDALLKVHQSQNAQGRRTSTCVDASTSPDGIGSTSPDGIEAMQPTDVRFVWTCIEVWMKFMQLSKADLKPTASLHLCSPLEENHMSRFTISSSYFQNNLVKAMEKGLGKDSPSWTFWYIKIHLTSEITLSPYNFKIR